VALPILCAAAPAPKPATRVEADNAVRAALAGAGDNAKLQAEALVRLAWPKQGPRDPAIGARARQEIVGFGAHGLPALEDAVVTVPAQYRAEVVASIIEARQYFVGPMPVEYIPALESALWFGTREAKLLAFDELGRLRDNGATLPIMDSAVDDPEILVKAIDTLGTIGDDRARFFLAEQLNKGTLEVRERAAVALARIQGRALEALRAAIRSDNQKLRELSVRALLPVATENELGELYEYVAARPGDDPALLTAVRDTTQQLERLLEIKRQADAADAPKDF
jgi:hypothetical protein